MNSVDISFLPQVEDTPLERSMRGCPKIRSGHRGGPSFLHTPPYSTAVTVLLCADSPALFLAITRYSSVLPRSCLFRATEVSDVVSTSTQSLSPWPCSRRWMR